VILSPANKVVGFLNPFYWTGPIFEKELKVSSRRKRYYLLRFSYLLLMIFFITMTWLVQLNSAGFGSSAFRSLRMSEAGKYITITIVWFQFLAVQLIGAVVLSTAISDEIYHRTLGVLMSTPISSFQIIVGKLLGRLLHLVLLLAFSLPLLSLVRIFGGVPWDYVLCGTCVSLAAAFFVASVSLFWSLYKTKITQVVGTTALVCIILYAGLPALDDLLSWISMPITVPDGLVIHSNPFIVMSYNTRNVLTPTSGGSFVFWPLHCVVMLGLSVPWLVLAVISLRRVALRQLGVPATSLTRPRKQRVVKKQRSKGSAVYQPPRPVKGPPLIWLELSRSSFLSHSFKMLLKLIFLSVLFVLSVILACISKEEIVLSAFVIIYFFILLYQIAIAAARSVTSEKEAGTWPTLLTVPLDDGQIIMQKIAACCLRAWPFWLWLLGHIFIFTVLGYIHPVSFALLVILSAGSTLLVSSWGVCISCLSRQNSTASFLSILGLLFFTMPTCFPNFLINPILISSILVNLSPNGGQGGIFTTKVGFLMMFASNFWIAVLLFFAIIGLYLLLALVAFALAKAKVRKKVY